MVYAQLVGDIIVVGILMFSAMTHGIVYYRMRDHRLYGTFALLCALFAAYSTTNIIALYSSADINSYILTSKLSSVFVILSILALAWFSAEYIQDYKNIPLKLIAAALAPFFIINLFMENGILWSSIDGIELSERSIGGNITKPINPVISWPMYALWLIIAIIYILLARAAFISLRLYHRKRASLLFLSLVLLTAGYIFDMTIDLGINPSYIYLSEYIILAIVILMSLHLTDELRTYANELEHLVLQRTEELQRSNEELKTFSYSVSHDLRAPLRTINGFMNILNQDYSEQLDKDAQNLINKVFNGVHRMEAIIEGMLELTRITRNEIQKENVNISQIATEIINNFKEKDPHRQVDATVDENIYCMCDSLLIRILLENLISNAWKYTSHSEDARISIKTYVSESGKQGFSVFDNGVGFNEAYADKLFIPFQRLHNIEDFPGIGIGLATVDRIVKRHGGKIWAKSNEGEGTTFYVLLD